MAAGIEDGVEVFGVHRVELDGVGEGFLGVLVRLEAAGVLGLGAFVIAFGVKRGLAALGRGEGEFRAAILEGVIGRGEFLEPETGLFAGVAEFVMGGQDH